MFPMEQFGSERCVTMSEENAASPIEDLVAFSSSRETIKASCSKLGSTSIVRLYARFEVLGIIRNNSNNMFNDDGDSVEVPKCCRDPYKDSSSLGASLPSSYKVVEYEFNIRCSATCDDPERCRVESPSAASEANNATTAPLP